MRSYNLLLLLMAKCNLPLTAPPHHLAPTIMLINHFKLLVSLIIINEIYISLSFWNPVILFVKCRQGSKPKHTVFKSKNPEPCQLYICPCRRYLNIFIRTVPQNFEMSTVSHTRHHPFHKHYCNKLNRFLAFVNS